MKEIVARAVLREKDVLYNEGYIIISDNFAKGVFSGDFIKMCIEDNKILMHFTENVITNGNYSWEIKSKINISIFETSYFLTYFSVPEIYEFHNEDGRELILSIDEIIYDKEIISLVQEEIGKQRY